MGTLSNAGRGQRLDRRRRPARAERRDARAVLLAAAAQVFAERGFREASVDEIAARAGYSKGALYWHFASKDDVFFALVDELVDAPTHEMIELLESAPPEQDMAPEASRRFVELLNGQRELLLLVHEYWSLAARDARLRARYAQHRDRLRTALGKALAARVRHLGGPRVEMAAEQMATVLMSLAAGLAQERLIQPKAVPEQLLGQTLVLIYRGLIASAAGEQPSAR